MIRGTDIETIEVAELRTPHRLGVALVAIIGGTGALVAYSLLPWVNLERTDWPEVFGVVAVAGGVLWKALMSRASVRAWMTKWDLAYEMESRP